MPSPISNMVTPDDELDFEHHVMHSNGMNSTENKLYDAMKSIGLGPKPQYKISKMTVDFAFPEEMLVIEVNGPYHNTEDQRVRDSKRWYVMQKEGWNRKSFSSDQVNKNPLAIAQIIKNLLKKYGYVDSDPLSESDESEETLAQKILKKYPQKTSKQTLEAKKEIKHNHLDSLPLDEAEKKRRDSIMNKMWNRICKNN